MIRESIKENYNFFSGELSDPKFDIKQEADWRRYTRAQSVPVADNGLTREFLGLHRESYNDYGWTRYMVLQAKRQRMGEYCRSNLDWDWDTSSCLKRLFRIDRPKVSMALQQGVTELPATIHLARGGLNKQTLDVTIPEPGPNELDKVRIHYKNGMGEFRYKTFYAGPSVEDEDGTRGDCAYAGPGSGKSTCQETGEYRASLWKNTDLDELTKDVGSLAEALDGTDEVITTIALETK